ncbi:TetR/AcrR family transcriptional regulator [Bacillus atrophaeus]|uniref:TetR/AcrR family transcriptional regulator n=1 Tax=Bacillus atrophaeus TaxID=1452 RepID=UPI00227EA985|nr:TetR/AcrR family transcriptional regulator [Bacillus atrophaeus]MCY8824278.1 TetR/AcrR family transcriptional regulator [Bacillus atrophaeus]MCY8840630.1 TetR/AcrR family transcriptional regulator [Bacillus atrophaeus]MEC0804884.1 TetR/AcrR family transcriptional regulator [Bacillus atrophaeus]MEC0852801.1 TetR/AcrR family transcriptional regulator [Bacillus atrophaeus]MEC0855927.1 TetR/AcrR family transcriptional regulator [Bacillus atrophaeus]
MPRTGRPREFNREEAVNAAMFLFWEHGFEATSLAQLRAAMGGISAASFYAAFGSKEALFREVMQQYISTYGQVSESFSDTRMTSKAAIEQGLRRSARMQTEESHPLGCLLVLSAVNCSPEQKHIREMLANEREKVRSWIKGCIERAVSNGELPDSSDIQMLATLFHTFLQGISTQARDGVSYEKIDAAITQLMSIWDAQSAKPVV